jgi:hypothetical protein
MDAQDNEPALYEMVGTLVEWNADLHHGYVISDDGVRVSVMNLRRSFPFAVGCRVHCLVSAEVQYRVQEIRFVVPQTVDPEDFAVLNDRLGPGRRCGTDLHRFHRSPYHEAPDLPLLAQVDDLSRQADDEHNEKAGLRSEEERRVQVSNQRMTVRNPAQGFGDGWQHQQKRRQAQADRFDISGRTSQPWNAPYTVTGEQQNNRERGNNVADRLMCDEKDCRGTDQH